VVCTSSGWGTVSGACIGPASLKLELVGTTSPVAAGQSITIKATLSQANANVAGQEVTFAQSLNNCVQSATVTDASGSVQLTCTVPLLAPLPLGGQPAPSPANLAVIATATLTTPPVTTVVVSPTLVIVVA
jgi:hypothetical protein